MLITEMHFTEKSYLNLPNYTVYHTSHPAGTAIIITNSIKHHQLNNYSQDFLQETSVSVEDSVGLLTILAVYLPAKYTTKQEQLEDFYNTLGRRFIAGGYYNAKHTDWGSRLVTPRGVKYKKRNNLKHLSMGEPTYWPSDRNKLSGLPCYKAYSPRLRCSKIVFRPILRSFSALDHTKSTCAEPRETTKLKQ
jgi:hypothetical protein